MKHDLPYFSHYSTTHNEPVMQALLAEYGFEGFGRFWILCEKIAASPNAILDISSRVIKLTIARSLGLSVDDFDSFIEFLNASDINLIKFVDNDKISTDHLQEDYLKVARKRKKDRDDYHSNNSPVKSQNPSTETPISSTENIQMRSDEMRSDYIRSDDDMNNLSSSFSKNQILDISKSFGFNISPEQAMDFISNIKDTTWFKGEFNFLVFAAEHVRSSKKPHDEQIRFFIKSWSQNFCIEKYPEWRKNKIAEAAAQEKRQQYETAAQKKREESDKALADKPKKCECGKSLELNEDRGICGCGIRYLFDEETGVWTHSVNLANVNSFSQLLKNHVITGAPIKEEIDF